MTDHTAEIERLEEAVNDLRRAELARPPQYARGIGRRRARAEMELARARTAAIVATGRCPQCGSALKRNLSMPGWWQCEQYGASGFRARPDEPSCSWQGFTS